MTSAYPARDVTSIYGTTHAVHATDFTSTYLWMIGLSAMLVFPD